MMVEKTTVCRILDPTERKEGLLVREYFSAQGYIRRETEDLYSATKQFSDSYWRSEGSRKQRYGERKANESNSELHALLETDGDDKIQGRVERTTGSKGEREKHFQNLS